MNEQKVQYLPFHAINEFMRDDFRIEIVKSVLQGLAGLPNDQRTQVEKTCKENIRIPGFRNINHAPVNLKIKPAAEAFEKSPKMVSAFLSAWSEIYSELRQQVYELLVAQGWEVLPVLADRSRLPGFLIIWPSGSDFDSLFQEFMEKYPKSISNIDYVSLMVVWMSGRLPYQNSNEGLESTSIE